VYGMDSGFPCQFAHAEGFMEPFMQTFFSPGQTTGVQSPPALQIP
jgi:hypothetical protein